MGQAHALDSLMGSATLSRARLLCPGAPSGAETNRSCTTTCSTAVDDPPRGEGQPRWEPRRTRTRGDSPGTGMGKGEKMDG